ncbi:hypothetical protein INR49_021115, partial [Caranx melampygus]
MVLITGASSIWSVVEQHSSPAAMSFVDTLRQWDEAITCAERQDFPGALRIFISIQEPNSKICFDLGCLHLLNQDLDAAEKVLHNMALAQARLGKWEKAQEHLAKALDYKTETKLNMIDRALQSILKQKLFKLVEFPSKELFKPNKNYVAELEKKDYLGKAKVVASVVPQDDFSGFAPLQPQVEDGPTRPKEPEVLRALEGEPHTVLYEFVPETPNELAVVPGNIVFVLQKGADSWASVVFNGRKGLVPYNYLEPLEISRASSGAVRTPPSKEPPMLPVRKQDPKESSGEEEKASYIVKVRFTFNFTVSVPPGSPYTVLIEKISKKVNLPPTSIILSLTSEVTERSVINADTEMERVWRHVKGGHITLWCSTKEVETDGKGQTEIHLVALHSYESSSPEDLSFSEGDTITLLSRINQDWFEGQLNGNTGIFPASFVEEVPAIAMPLLPSTAFTTSVSPNFCSKPPDCFSPAGFVATVIVWFLRTTEEPYGDSEGSLLIRLLLRRAPVIKD